MPNIILSADAEQEMRQILNLLDLQSVIQILEKQTKDLPPELQQFYMDEIDLWGAIGDKKQLINAIINITEESVGLDSVMDLFETLTQPVVPLEAHEQC
jgi:hypothetical protein